jgi:bleomycin hydrolase
LVLVFQLIMIILFTLSFGQTTDPRIISPTILEKIEKSLTIDSQTRAIMNAVSSNDINKLALSRDVLESLDHYFTCRIESGEVTNQKSSGRCWLFSALNVLRPAIIKKYQFKNFEFSENYLFFWDQFEKSNRFLEAVIETRDKKMDDRLVEWIFKHALDDGGVWNMMGSLAQKYGMVPKEAMQESYSSDNTRRMNQLIARKLREGGFLLRKLSEQGKNEKQLREQKIAVLSEIYRMLVICLGEPPKEFNWRFKDKNDQLSAYKKYTPRQFYHEFIEEDLNSYVMLMDDPSKEYNRLYEIEYDRNVWESQNWTFINVPVDRLKQFAKKSIMAGYPMYFSCDVGKQLYTEDGYLALGVYDYESLLGVKFGMDKTARILTFDSGSTHGMALMGVDTSGSGITSKWLLENSWGKEKGDEGYLTMTDSWMNEYMFRLVVKKDFLPQDVLQVLEQRAIKLPPWDPMY